MLRKSFSRYLVASMNKLLIHSLIVSVVFVKVNGDFYEDSIEFTVYNSLTGVNFTSTFNETLESQGCKSNESFALATHGWLASKDDQWVAPLINNLITNRGGCIIFMDYSKIANVVNYFALIPHFANISAVLLKKLKQLESEKFDPANGFMFGFSFGARLVIDAASKFGFQRFKNIDVCDPAPGLDDSANSVDPQSAAQNVQCIHSSGLSIGNPIGEFICHQNWRMGYCGTYQPGTNFFMYLSCTIFKQCDPLKFESHNLCPHFYNSAFQNDFYAQNSYYCQSSRPALNLPDNYKMGYMETRRSNVILGDIYAPTTENSPWNVSNVTRWIE